MESWRSIWREGFAKVLPLKGLEALADALRADDPRLVQGATTYPPPVLCVDDWPCEQACALGYAGWQGESLATVGNVAECFSRYCIASDALTGGPGDCRWFLNWFDDCPRDEVRRELLPEVERAIRERTAGGLTPAQVEMAGAT